MWKKIFIASLLITLILGAGAVLADEFSSSGSSGHGEANVPAAPSNLSATLGPSASSVSLGWTDNSGDESDFKIYRRVSGGAWVFLASASPGVTSYIDSGVLPGTYDYQVAACNSYGCSSGSNEVSVAVVSVTTTTTTTTSASENVDAARVSGKVLDSLESPVAGAGVRIFKKDFSRDFGTLADSDGKFQLEIPAGTYLAEVFSPSGRTDILKPAPVEFSVASGETRDLTLQFAGAAKTVKGTVSFYGGAWITDAEVGAYSKKTGQWTSVFTDSEGKYTLRVGGGKWEVGVRPRDPKTAGWQWTGPFQKAEFSEDNSFQTKTINFFVVTADAVLTVKTVDEAGSPVPRAGVVVDAISAREEFTAVRVPPEFRESDSSGSAVFRLREGTYYLRAFLPPDRGFVNPAEVKVELAPGSTREVRLVFSRRTAATTFSVSGMAKLDDGRPVDAFVWAWSEQGRRTETRADSKGTFRLELAAGDKWRVGAGKEVSGFPYKSSEVTVGASAGATVSVELVLTRMGEAPLASKVSVIEDASRTVVAQTTDGAKVSIPPAAAASSGGIAVDIQPTIEVPTLPAAKPIGTAYDVSVKVVATGKEIKEFGAEIEVRLPYDPADLAAEGVTEDEIAPNFFDETTGTWVKVDNFTIDKDAKVVIARVKHLTRFAIVAAADITPPDAPTGVAVRTLGQGQVRITWVNPTRDFSHAKVYRSGKLGELGSVVAPEVTSGTFTDSDGLLGGTTYYYTVRAVDPAGNESTNTNQVSVAVVGAAAPEAKKPEVPPGIATKAEILRNLTAGSTGDDVRTLQQLLLDEGVYPEGLVTGFFGDLTKQAVVRFQEKYPAEILTPVGLSSGTGFVGLSTLKKINELLGVPTKEKPEIPPGQALKAEILRSLTVGSTGDDVKTLQQLLLEEGVYPEGLITGYFGSLTKQAVIRFQEKYLNEVLAPVGESKGTGFVGPSTRKKINELL